MVLSLSSRLPDWVGCVAGMRLSCEQGQSVLPSSHIFSSVSVLRWLSRCCAGHVYAFEASCSAHSAVQQNAAHVQSTEFRCIGSEKYHAFTGIVDIQMVLEPSGSDTVLSGFRVRPTSLWLCSKNTPGYSCTVVEIVFLERPLHGWAMQSLL